MLGFHVEDLDNLMLTVDYCEHCGAYSKQSICDQCYSELQQQCTLHAEETNSKAVLLFGAEQDA